MYKTELARKIQSLDGLSNEEKTALLELIRGHKKYGLVWEEKPEDIEDKLREELPVLIERNDEKVHPIISDNPEAPNHFIIEGDNLDEIYYNFFNQMSGYRVDNSEAISEIREIETALAKLQRHAEDLQKRVRDEKQFNRQIELNAQLREQRKNISDLETKLANLKN